MSVHDFVSVLLLYPLIVCWVSQDAVVIHWEWRSGE